MPVHTRERGSSPGFDGVKIKFYYYYYIIIGRPTSATSDPQHGSTSKSAGTAEDSTNEKLPTQDVGKTPFQQKKSYEDARMRMTLILPSCVGYAVKMTPV